MLVLSLQFKRKKRKHLTKEELWRLLGAVIVLYTHKCVASGKSQTHQIIFVFFFFWLLAVNGHVQKYISCFFVDVIILFETGKLGRFSRRRRVIEVTRYSGLLTRCALGLYFSIVHLRPIKMRQNHHTINPKGIFLFFSFQTPKYDRAVQCVISSKDKIKNRGQQNNNNNNTHTHKNSIIMIITDGAYFVRWFRAFLFLF